MGYGAMGPLSALIGLQPMGLRGPGRPFAPPIGAPPWLCSWGLQFSSFSRAPPPHMPESTTFIARLLEADPMHLWGGLNP